MSPQNRKSKLLWLLGVLAVIGGFAISLLAARHTADVRRQERKPVTSQATLPKLISRVKKMEIVSATVQREGESDAVVTIGVRNNSDLPVTYFALTNGSIKTNEYGVARNGLDDPDNPQVVIESYAVATIDMLLSNLDGQYPIVLSAAVFADNSEDGDESVLEHVRAVRARDKAKRDAEKERARREAEKGGKP